MIREPCCLCELASCLGDLHPSPCARKRQRHKAHAPYCGCGRRTLPENHRPCRGFSLRRCSTMGGRRSRGGQRRRVDPIKGKGAENDHTVLREVGIQEESILLLGSPRLRHSEDFLRDAILGIQVTKSTILEQLRLDIKST